MIEVNVSPDKYVLAVSGGVDSMVLLDLLANKPGIELVVAHFNHGIREDSRVDEMLVHKAARKYGLKFELGRADLGNQPSEEQARNARYSYLKSVRAKHNAKAIITAHHQDDKLETALINLLRGTGRQGLAAISSNPAVLRPLLNTPKQEIMLYAHTNGLAWHDDYTNDYDKYLRNYLRNNILAKLNPQDRQVVISNIDKVAKTNININQNIATMSRKVRPGKQIDRRMFSGLPVDIGNELVIYWLRQLGLTEFDKKTVDRLGVAIRTSKPISSHSIKGKYYLVLSDESAQISNTL